MQDEIKSGIKGAMMAKDTVRLGVLRGLSAAFTNELVSLGRTPSDTLSDEEVMTIVKREVKRRKDAIEQFIAGGREDLADDEKAELVILTEFLPAQMSEEEIVAFAKSKISEAGDIDPAKKAQFVGSIIKELSGRADGGLIKKLVDDLLA